MSKYDVYCDALIKEYWNNEFDIEDGPKTVEQIIEYKLLDRTQLCYLLIKNRYWGVANTIRGNLKGEFRELEYFEESEYEDEQFIEKKRKSIDDSILYQEKQLNFNEIEEYFEIAKKRLILWSKEVLKKRRKHQQFSVKAI